MIEGKFNKTAKIIDEERDSPLLKITPDNLHRINHFLRLADRESVRAVLQHLNELGVNTYLGGSVVENYLFNGERKYNDIDISGVAGDVLYRIFKELDSGKISLGKTSFSINNIELGHYADITVPETERYFLRPQVKGLRRLLGKPKDIDLTLMGHLPFRG